MGRHETRHMGDGGQIVSPKDMRDRLGIQPGDEVTFEARPDGVVILPGNASARRGSSRSRSSGRSARSGSSRSGRSTSGRSSRSTSSRASAHPRHAERTDDCF